MAVMFAWVGPCGDEAAVDSTADVEVAVVCVIVWWAISAAMRLSIPGLDVGRSRIGYSWSSLDLTTAA